MNTNIGAAIFAVGLGLLGIAHADSWDSLGNRNRNVIVENRSSITIDSIYMSGVNDTSWESDLLGSSELDPGYHTTILATPGRYDVKLVDGDGDKCVINNVEIRGDRTLTITTDMLMRCEGYR
jgi:hypothetical protein